MTETIITGKAYRVLTDVSSDTWAKVSLWTAADDVEMPNSQDLPTFLESKAPTNDPSFTGKLCVNSEISDNGDYSTTLGNSCISTGEGSLAGGLNSEANGDVSFVYGEGLESNEDNISVLGKYNDSSVTDGLLVIGNGTDDSNRSNALVLDKDGNLEVQGNIEAKNITADGDIAITGDFTNGDGETLSEKLDLSDLEEEVDYSSAGGLVDVITVGTLSVGEQQYNILTPVPDFNVSDSSAPGFIKNKPTIPTTASDLTVTGGGNLQFCLDNMQQEISEIPKMKKLVVNSLPTTNIDTDTLYLLVSSSQSSQGNLYDEYINLDGTTSGWELIGSQSGSIDLHDYYTKTETEQKIQDAIDDIFSTGQAGQFLVSDGNGGYNWVTIPTAENNNF